MLIEKTSKYVQTSWYLAMLEKDFLPLYVAQVIRLSKSWIVDLRVHMDTLWKTCMEGLEGWTDGLLWKTDIF